MNHPPTARQHRRGHRGLAALAATALVAVELVATVAPATAAPHDDVDYTSFVDPFIGTESDFGQDGPGAFTPNGLAKVTPLTEPRSHTGYDYDSTQMLGFTGITLDGVGGNGAGGDFLVVPTYQTFTARPSTSSYRKGYSHANEEASPGLYAIDDLAEGSRTIDARVTAATRTGVHEYTFDQAGTGSLVVDLRNNFGSRNGATLSVGTTAEGNTSLSGRLDGFFYNASYRMYYYAETTRPASSVQTWRDADLSITQRTQEGTDIGAILRFDVAAGETVGMRVTFSPISVAQARRDMAAEVAGRSFDDVHAAAKAEWNEALGVVDIQEGPDDDPSGDLKTLFYTHLFRMNGSPINATSTDGTYRGVDGKIYSADGYTHYDSWALWDDFRKYSSIAMIYPDRFRDIAQSLVDLFAELAASDKTSLNQLTHSVPTVRWERAAVVIADAISKGARLEGLELAYPALKAHSNGRYSSSTNEALGYVPNGVAETVGTSYDDWGMAVIAEALGKHEDAERFRTRSLNYVNLFDRDALASNGPALAAGVADVGLIMPRTGSGDFVAADPERFEVSGAGLYQGTLWQYHWYTAQDMGGLIELMGGREAARRALGFHFGEQEPDNCRRMLHSNANEIDLQAPFLFNYVGAAHRTQYWARHILTEESCNRYIATGSTSEAPSGGGEFSTPAKMRVYRNHPQGFLPTMDNDAGTMSSVFVGGALGLFPVTSGSDSFQIASPFFERATLRHPGGKTFVIEAEGVDADNFYVQEATLDGAPLERTWLTFDEITSGGVLHLTMGDEPSTWGEDGPMAYSLSDEVDSHVYDPERAVSTSRRVFAESAANDGSIDTTVTLTAHGTAFSGEDGADLSELLSASGLPAGLALRATRTSGTTLELALVGRATNHSAADSTDGLVVSLAPEAFEGSVPSAHERELALKLRFTGYGATLSSTTVQASPAGVVDATLTLDLTGGAELEGTIGEALTGVELAGLAAGLSAQVVKTSATRATITLAGTLEKLETSTFVVSFDDDAFTGSVTAAQVTGAGLSALSPVTISVRSERRSELAELVDEALLVKPGAYSKASFAALEGAIERARTLLDDHGASQAALRQGVATLEGALAGLAIDQGGYRRLEAEDHDVWSGGELKTEGGGTGVNVGGVERGAWLGFLGLDFSDAPLGSFVVAYAHNPGSASASSSMEIRTGAPDGALVTTIDLPTTGGWGSYVTLSHALTPAEVAALEGTNDVFLVFRGGDDTNRRWVANIDYVEFVPYVEDPAFEFVELGPNDVELGPGMGRDGSSGAYTNFGNTHDGEWIGFHDVDLGPDGANVLRFSYDKPSSRTPADSWIEVRLGSPEGETVAASGTLPHTASGWGTYDVWEMAVDREVFTGVQDVFIVFRMHETHTDGSPYVGNFRWFRFGDTNLEKDTSRTTLELESIRAGHGNLRDTAELVAEEDFSGNGLKTEGGNGGSVLAGTENGFWVRYQDVDLADAFSGQLLVTYAAPSHRVNEPSIAIYLDSLEGEPFVTAPLAITGGSWSDYSTAVIDLPAEISGRRTIYLEFRSVPIPEENKRNVGNFDAITFVHTADKSALRAKISEVEGIEGSLFVPADFAAFERTLAAARTVAGDPAASEIQVASATRQLDLAAGQLEWKVARQLERWVATAEAVDPASIHPLALERLEARVAKARALDPARDPHEAFVSALAELTAEYERSGRYVATTTRVEVTSRAFDDERLTAVVTVSGGATGQVELALDGKRLASRTLDARGRATFDLGRLATGTRRLTASYAGEGLFLPSSSPAASVSVAKRLTVSRPTLSRKTQPYGAVKKLRAEVSVTVTGATSGTVTFTSGKTTLGTAKIRRSGSKHTATLRISGKLPRGKYRDITATVRAAGGERVTSVPSRDSLRVSKSQLRTARPKVTARSFRAGTRPAVKVRLGKLTNGRYPAGWLRVKVGKRNVRTVKLLAKHEGRRTIRLPRAYRSSVKVSVRYLARSPEVVRKSAWSKKVTVRARR